MRSITVGGLPGTGTSTLCRRLKERLDLPYTYTGQLFRDEAAARGLDLAAFGALCEEDPAVDKVLDDQQVKLLRGAPLILEGRLAGWLAHRNGLGALKVWVTCNDDERHRRLVERDGGVPVEQAAKAAAREASERARYLRYYGIDLQDLTPYDLVLDSTKTSPEDLAARVLQAL